MGIESWGPGRLESVDSQVLSNQLSHSLWEHGQTCWLCVALLRNLC